jgi:3-hydroxyisobutyrate dehydrogenase-like beta-hydroxyacid dehydrogenase
MRSQHVGILHPGQMGVSLAAAAQHAGRQVHWASQDRGPATRARAETYGLHDSGSLERLCAACEVVVSVCPPDAAEELARQAAAAGFDGLYVDANAIAPRRAEHMAQVLASAGGSFVDGGIIGGPAWQAGETWLYLSGPRADEAAAIFAGSPLETRVLSERVGDASALKMCYAAYSKGTTALLCAVLAAAEQLGVRTALDEQWERDTPGAAAQAARRARRATAKAWRFAGEMDEIADTFRQAGLPDGFHVSAADLYRRLAHFKDAPDEPSLDAVLHALLASPTDPPP